MTQIFGWGSKKIIPTVTDPFRIHTSKILNEIHVNITDAEICEKALNRKLKKTELCGIGYNEGETAAQVSNSNKTCFTGRFSLQPILICLKGSKWVKKSIFFSSLFDCICIPKYACKISGRNSKNCGSHEFFVTLCSTCCFWN